MILTNDLKIAKKAKYFTTQAKDDSIYSIHNEIGYNFRMANINAALGLAQLESLSKYIRKKKIIHERYKKKINKIKNLSVSDVPDVIILLPLNERHPIFPIVPVCLFLNLPDV